MQQQAPTVGRPIGRKNSVIIIINIYILATAVGIVTYCMTTGTVWLRLLLADVAATVLTFLFSLLLRNASVYDPYWSVQPPVILLLVMIGRGTVLSLPHILLFSVVTLWAVRLTANWAYTFGGLSHQDWRYTMLAETTGAFYPIVNFLGIHLVPTLVVYACTLPAVYVCLSDAPFSPLSVVGLGLCLLAIVLQTVSDIQMQTYRRHRTTTFIEVGLWKYSRHPNYLGEILMWWGVALFAVATLGVSYLPLVLGALCNTALFFFVSLPMAERRQAKKEGFDAYRDRTRLLLPFPRR